MNTDEGNGPLTPEQLLMAEAAIDLAAGDLVAVENGYLSKVHKPGQCAGEHCWVHAPSPHHMTSWPIKWRHEKGTAERVCPHGIGHPDPDDVAYNVEIGRDVTMHGCDGCCDRS